MLKPLRIEIARALTFAGRNGRFPIGPSPGIKELWHSFMEDFGRIEGQLGMKCYGVCHAFDHDNHMNYLAAAAVADAGQVPGYLFTLTVPERKVAVFAHDGAIETISQTWSLIFSEGLEAAKLTLAPGPQFEVYPEEIGLAGATPRIEIHIPVN